MEEEISLRELIETLLKGKIIIIIVTLFAVIISSIYSYFVYTPKYQVEATILTNHLKKDELMLNTYIDEMVSPQIIINRMKSPEVLSRLLEKGTLSTKYSLSNLQDVITVEQLPNSSVVNVRMKSEDSKEAAKIINVLIIETKKYIAENMTANLSKLNEQYQSQMESEQKRLNEAIEEFNQKFAGSQLPSLILFEQRSESDKFTVEINQDLLVEYKDIEKSQEIEFIQLNEKIQKMTQLYNNYSKQYAETLSINPDMIVESNITVLSEAIESNNPLSPSKMLIIAIWAILGCIAGVFLVFFKNYWTSTNDKKINLNT
ncbi:hypothetical protein IM538_21635 [Cytobacillus suaedae]|nr:hypothetical protein IM538_21635 [Cytobacillus suaedae]